MMALYVIIVSALYGLLWWKEPRAADAFVAVAVFFILVPAIVWEVRWWRRGGGPRANS